MKESYKVRWGHERTAIHDGSKSKSERQKRALERLNQSVTIYKNSVNLNGYGRFPVLESNIRREQGEIATLERKLGIAEKT